MKITNQILSIFEIATEKYNKARADFTAQKLSHAALDEYMLACDAFHAAFDKAHTALAIGQEADGDDDGACSAAADMADEERAHGDDRAQYFTCDKHGNEYLSRYNDAGEPRYWGN